MKPFYTCSVNEFELVSNHINYMIEQHAQILQFMKANFSPEFHHLLAKPEKIGVSINWYTELSGEFKRVEAYPNDVRSNMLNIYNARKHEIEATCNRLAESDDFDRQLWADILKSAFNPDHLFLFSNGTDVLVVWGIKTFKQADYTVPFDSYKTAIVAPISEVEDQISEIPPEIPEEHVEEVSPAVETQNTASSLEVDDPSDSTEETLLDSDEIEEPNVETTAVLEEPIEEPIKKEETKKPVPPISKKHWFYSALDRFEIFAGRYWWIILILMILLLWFLLDRCNRPADTPPLSKEDVEEIYDEIMPEIPRKRIMPIDTTQFREDDESGNVIVAGLVNIAMVDKKNAFKRMAVELKQEFPNEEYKIVYYDEETNRLQLNFPEDQANIKDQIRTKLPQYELLIWDESVFQSSKKSNDPFYSDVNKTWHMKAINLEGAWDITMGDTSVVVAVIDDGFDLKHKEFKGTHIVNRYNVEQDNTRVFSSAEIIHGTHVAGLALANANNNSGGSGVAPNCSFMPVQIGNGQPFFTMTDVVDGVLYALNHGADVINMSLGKAYGEELQGRSPSELEQIINSSGKDEEKFWKELFKLADKKNAFIVLAGGNEDLLIGLDPMQRSDEVLKVVAVDEQFRKAGFSNYCKNCMGKNTYVSAPGVNIFSTVPGNQFESMQGTSMAAPIVTGAIALMKSANPRLKNKEIFKILRQSSKTLPDRSCPPFLQVDIAVKKAKGR
jgi:subtilisin family serine protease